MFSNMSFCKKIGKDKIIFLSKEDQLKPSNVQLKELDERFEPKGLILPNGDINWNCPCLGGMASGPCGFFFRQAFGCFHNSQAEPKGSDCIPKFTEMQSCMTKYPNLYPQNRDSDDQFNFDDAANQSSASSVPIDQSSSSSSSIDSTVKTVTTPSSSSTPGPVATTVNASSST